MVKIRYNALTGEIERPAYDSESFPDIDGDHIEVENSVWADAQKYESLKVNIETLDLEHDAAEDRESKMSEINSAYIAERTTANKGITSSALGGAIIDCRESDVINIQNLITLLEAQGATEYYYKLKDNTNVDCTVAQIKAVLTELIAALLSMWQLKQTLTEQIDAATTAEEIQAIKWEWTQS